MVPWRLRLWEMLGPGWEGVYPLCSMGTQVRVQRGLGDMGGQCQSLAMATLPGDPRAHLRPSKVPEGPRPGPQGRSEFQPGRCRQH